MRLCSASLYSLLIKKKKKKMRKLICVQKTSRKLCKTYIQFLRFKHAAAKPLFRFSLALCFLVDRFSRLLVFLLFSPVFLHG